ncbi:MAG: hypothetical protein CL596_05020 [Alteromonas sp.]|nr:hypothetical protein [Alteromonas sp.]|tara:strand:- start:1277 stop:1816 length:540 start_codon:yes stop_codon:yes gene_type:complete
MANSKGKGSKNERELCKWWEGWSGLEFNRVPASGGLRWKKTDNISSDIICTDDRYSRRFPFSIETKFYKDINFEHLILGNKKQRIIEFWEQVIEDADRANKIPLLFMRYNGMPKKTWFVALENIIYNKAKKCGLVKTDKAIFKVETGEYKFIIINSNDLLNIDFKKFSITCKKYRRKWD